MERLAIFVDAGYLYAAGSIAITGSIQSRVNLVLKRVEVIQKLAEIACAKADNAKLLRIYWYDGITQQGISVEQQMLADTDDVKLRLGIVNTYGQQKGVDSLIVTDMVELARNHAITDAVLLSGDEDVRIGVQIAQSFGVRVHLLGIESRGAGNQARSLRQETDTTTEWNKGVVIEFLSAKGETSSHLITPTPVTDIPATSEPLDAAVEEIIASLRQDELNDIASINATSMLPKAFDGQLLAISGKRIGRFLDETEKRYVRSRFREQARLRAQSD